ncbi:unnamed protein product, partial [Schistosoma rodhaini]
FKKSLQNDGSDVSNMFINHFGQIGLYAGNYIGLMKNHVIGCFSSECEISND